VNAILNSADVVERENNHAVCFHCGQSISDGSFQEKVHGKLQSFCCTGCSAATLWIEDAGLSDYYQLRTEQAPQADANAVDLSAWDHPDTLRQHARLRDGCDDIIISVQGMHCAACAWLIDRALSKQKGVSEVSVNAVTGRLHLRWQQSTTPLSQLISCLQRLGYRAFLTRGSELEKSRAQEKKTLLLRIGLAALVAMQTMMFAEALYLDSSNEMSIWTRDMFRWLCFVTATPVVFYSGMPFIRGMLRELKQKALGMDVLAASSILLAYFGSFYQTLIGGQHVWYDAAVMFVLFLLVARFLEYQTRQAAYEQSDALARAQPYLAQVIRAEMQTAIPLSELSLGDTLCISPGETVSADGILLNDAASFDESLLTGEARPVTKYKGDFILAGSIGSLHSARLQVTQVGRDTQLSQLLYRVELAQLKKSGVLHYAERIARYFVIGIVLLTALVYGFWTLNGSEHAFEIALAVLVVSCPCALALALPAAFASAQSALAKIGVLSFNNDGLVKLAQVDTFIFDKTGTLTEGKITRIDARYFINDKNHALAIACALEKNSLHPLASAFPESTNLRADPESTNLRADNVQLIPGKGISGLIGQKEYRIGSADFAANSSDDGRLWLGDGKQALASFSLSDHARQDAKTTVSALHHAGLQVHLLSGDAAITVNHFAEEIGITNFSSRQNPDQKQAYLKALQSEGHSIAMIGDGINDALVLASADVSIAMGTGAAIAQRSADMVICGEKLDRIFAARELAIKTQVIIKQNLTWALLYNLIAIPVSAMGFIHPGFAALGMVSSSLLVSINALRLRNVSVSK
jgi:P-type Cu2+ transporter